MKVLHLVSGEFSGGAARGAYWLHKALLDEGVDSKILCNAVNTFNDPSLVSIAKSKKGRAVHIIKLLVDYVLPHIFSRSKKYIFSSGMPGYDFRKTREYKEADVIHLHWVNKGFVNVKHLSKVQKPVIWTMRDMWPATGGCHYSFDCDRYKDGCGMCPQLESRMKYDFSSFVYNRKKKYMPLNLTVIGISSWVSEVASNSLIFKGYKIFTISNAIEADSFEPVDKRIARSLLKLPKSKKIILFGASDPEYFNKGFDLLVDVVKELNSSDYLLVSFGQPVNFPVQINLEHISLGYLQDTLSLKMVYSSADVFIATSRQEAFGKTLAESMACATPVVCFDTAGMKDIVDHKINGYKAKQFNVLDFVKGINWVLEDVIRCETLSCNARKKAEKSFNVKYAAKKYIDLYNNVLSH